MTVWPREINDATPVLSRPGYEDSYIYEQHAFFAAVEGEKEAIISPLTDAF